MKPFPLQKVLEYREYLRLEKRNALAAALAEEREQVEQRREIDSQREQLIEELRQHTGTGSFNVEAAARRRYYSGQLEVQLLIIDQFIAELREIVDKHRNELIEADREVKALERLKEQFVAEQTFQENRSAAIQLEEQWQAANWKW